MSTVLKYLRHNWVIYSLLILYALDLLLNALGIGVWLPACPVSHFIGHECLGCGLNRAAIALISGDLPAAFTLNPLIFIYLPLITGWISLDFYKFYSKYQQTTYENN